MEKKVEEEENINVPTPAEIEHLKRVMSLSLTPVHSAENANDSGAENDEVQNKISEKQAQKIIKRHSTFKKHGGPSVRKVSPRKEDIEIIKLALAESKNQIGSGLLQLEEVGSYDNASFVDQDDSSVEETITKHPQSTFYFTVTEADTSASSDVSELKQNDNQQSPAGAEKTKSKAVSEERKHSDASLHSNQGTTPEKKKVPKTKAIVESPLHKLFGGNKKEKEALKNFKRFEEDFLRILQYDEGDNWKCVALPSDIQKQEKRSYSEESPTSPSKESATTSENTVSQSQDNSSEQGSKSYFAGLPQKLSIRRKKNESYSTNSSNNQVNSKSNQVKKAASHQKVNSQSKNNKLTHTLNSFLRPSSKKLDDDILGKIFDQNEEKKWKSVVLTEEQLKRKEEERKRKLRVIEEKMRKKEMELKKLEREAMEIKLMEEEESKRKKSTSQSLELTIDRAFVVNPNEETVKESPIHKSFNPVMTLTRKLSTKLKRSASTRSSSRKSGSDSPTYSKKLDPSSTPTLNRLRFEKRASLKHATNSRDIETRNRHRSAPEYRYDGSSSEILESRGRSSFRNTKKKSPTGSVKSPVNSATQQHPLLRKAASLFFVRSSSQERNIIDSINNGDAERNRPWYDLHSAMEGRWKDQRSKSWGATMDRFESRYGFETNRPLSANSMTLDFRRSTRSTFSNSSSRQFTYYSNRASSLRNIDDTIAGRASPNGSLRKNHQENEGAKKYQIKNKVALRLNAIKSRSMSDIIVQLKTEADLPKNKTNQNSDTINHEKNTNSSSDQFNPPANQSSAAHNNDPLIPNGVGNDTKQHYETRGNITVDEISATLQIAEEDQEPIKFDFNKLNRVLAQSDLNSNHISVVVKNQSHNHQEPPINNQSSNKLLTKRRNENLLQDTTNSTLKSFQCKLNSDNFKNSNVKEVSEEDWHGKLGQYKKVLEIQQGLNYGSSSVSYISAAKSTGNLIYEEHGFYSTDSNEDMLYVYSSTGKEKYSIHVPGCPGGLTSLTSNHVLCTSSADGQIYVVDVARGNVVRKVNRRPILKNPRYITMHPSNRAYVTSDIQSVGVWRINMFDIRTGMLTAAIHSSHARNFTLIWPGFLTFRDASEQLHVSDAEGNYLSVFDIRNATQPVFYYGKTGCEDGELLNPCGVTFVNGYMAVADWGNNRISAFNATTGQFSRHLVVNSPSSKTLAAPYDLSSCKNNYLYLTESGRNSIHVYQPM